MYPVKVEVHIEGTRVMYALTVKILDANANTLTFFAIADSFEEAARELQEHLRER